MIALRSKMGDVRPLTADGADIQSPGDMSRALRRDVGFTPALAHQPTRRHDIRARQKEPSRERCLYGGWTSQPRETISTEVWPNHVLLISELEMGLSTTKYPGHYTSSRKLGGVHRINIILVYETFFVCANKIRHLYTKHAIFSCFKIIDKQIMRH